jgi:hypothetical protein
MKTSLSVLFAAMGCIVGSHVYAARSEFVTVSAVTMPGYQRVVDPAGNPRPEAYVLAEGGVMQGKTKDPALEKYSFKDILPLLGRSLAKQKYFPASDPNDSDLLIVVHFGATLTYDDPNRDLAIEHLNQAVADFRGGSVNTNEGPSSGLYTPNPDGATLMGDPGEINALSESLLSGYDARGRAIARNATLLGYADMLRKIGGANLHSFTETQRSLLDELAEERYFVILMAYDFNAYKNKKSVLRWTTRLSMPSPGNNFRDAVAMLSETGAGVFGRKLDRLSQVKGRVRSGEVIIGELKTISVD